MTCAARATAGIVFNKVSVCKFIASIDLIIRHTGEREEKRVGVVYARIRLRSPQLYQRYIHIFIALIDHQEGCHNAIARPHATSTTA
jgi:hypothetical protein